MSIILLAVTDPWHDLRELIKLDFEEVGRVGKWIIVHKQHPGTVGRALDDAHSYLSICHYEATVINTLPQ